MSLYLLSIIFVDICHLFAWWTHARADAIYTSMHMHILWFVIYHMYYLYVHIHLFILMPSICSVYMFLHVSSFFFITKIIDIVKMTPLVFEHVSTLTKKTVCVCMFSHYPHIYACLCVRHQVGHMRCVLYPPRSLTCRPWKVTETPIGKGLSSISTIFQGRTVQLRGCR